MASVNFNRVQRTDLSRGLKQEASSLKIILYWSTRKIPIYIRSYHGMYSSVKFSCQSLTMIIRLVNGTFIFLSAPPLPPPYGRYNQIISRRTLLESDFLTTIKGFGISILPTTACQILGLLRLLQGLWESGDIWDL